MVIIILSLTAVVIMTIGIVYEFNGIWPATLWKGDYNILKKCVIKDKAGNSYKVTHIYKTIDELELTPLKGGGPRVWVTGIRKVLKNQHKTHRIAYYGNGERYV